MIKTTITTALFILLVCMLDIAILFILVLTGIAAFAAALATTIASAFTALF